VFDQASRRDRRAQDLRHLAGVGMFGIEHDIERLGLHERPAEPAACAGSSIQRPFARAVFFAPDARAFDRASHFLPADLQEQRYPPATP